jgi:hypothetical protein
VLRPEEKMRVNGSLNTSVVRFDAANQGAGHGGRGGGTRRTNVYDCVRMQRYMNAHEQRDAKSSASFLELHHYIKESVCNCS